jgi:hypothetical protein
MFCYILVIFPADLLISLLLSSLLERNLNHELCFLSRRENTSQQFSLKWRPCRQRVKSRSKGRKDCPHTDPVGNWALKCLDGTVQEFGKKFRADPRSCECQTQSMFYSANAQTVGKCGNSKSIWVMNVEPPETLMILELIVYKSNGFAKVNRSQMGSIKLCSNRKISLPYSKSTVGKKRTGRTAPSLKVWAWVHQKFMALSLDVKQQASMMARSGG